MATSSPLATKGWFVLAKSVKPAKKKTKTGKSLVIVESPAKAKTINRYLGSGFEVMASMGHVRDLPISDLGVNLEEGFEPSYEVLAAKKKTVNSLKKAASNATKVYLATDLDREGEAIAWHLVHALGLDIETTQRVVFNEITKTAIQAAFSQPHDLNMDKVNAQQARRILDRVVGYLLSPLLQSKLGRGLSAGRVQSVAVRLIVDREKEIRAFIPEQWWRVQACFSTDPALAKKLSNVWQTFLGSASDGKNTPTIKQRSDWLTKNSCLFADLVKVGDKPFKPTNIKDARATIEALGYAIKEVVAAPWEQYKNKDLSQTTLIGKTDLSQAPDYRIKDIQKKRTTSKPNAPFTTATLQQAASSELGFAPSRTMRVAQQLYEGINIGDSEGPVGLITYMRTDSTNLSHDSVTAARSFVLSKFSEKHLPSKPNVFGKTKGAQEAHEAIRASDVERTPTGLKDQLTSEQFKLYDLIWRRFVASQMAPAQWDNTTILIATDTPQGEAIFRTGGRRLVFDGFLAVAKTSGSGDVQLPALEQNQTVGLVDLLPEEQASSPPPRYSEAALIKKMESEGIGRPSTYAAIIQTVQDRGYVDLLDKRLHPSARGEMVTEKLIEHFPSIMDIKFTSYMEEELDKIEDSHLDWVQVLQEFYTPFKQALDKAQTEMKRAEAEPSDFVCEDCGKPMVYRIGRNGRFLSCSGYPECKKAMNIDAEGQPIADVFSDDPCPECGKKMMLRRSRLGPFLGCTGYPECTYTVPSDDEGHALKKVQEDDIKQTCPACQSPMGVKFSRGRSFMGCSAYPKCKETTPLPPGVYVEKPKPAEAGVRCDKCGRSIVIRASRRGPFLSCSGFPRCRNAMPMDKIDHLRALEEAGEIPDAPPESEKGGSKSKKGKDVPRDKDGKVDYAAMGPPPVGFAWTRTGRPVVETWPDEDLTCPDCGQVCAIKTGRFGPYFGCSNYPKCRFVSNLRGAAKKHAELEIPGAVKPKPIPTNVKCEECGANMVIRTSRSGQFLGCSKYPKCKSSMPLPEGETAESLAATT